MFELIIIAVFIFAGCGCVAYAITRRRRQARALFGWLALPCFTQALLYVWFIAGNVPTVDRVFPNRLNLIMIGLFIGVITSIVAYMGKQKK